MRSCPSAKILQRKRKNHAIFPHHLGQWDRDFCHRRGRGSACAALPWLARTVLFLAASDPGDCGSRFSCRGAGYAGFWADHRARRNRRLHHLRQCRRHGRAGCRNWAKTGSYHWARLGRAGCLARRAVPSRHFHRRSRPERSTAVAWTRPAARYAAREWHHQLLLAVFSATRHRRSRVRAGYRVDDANLAGPRIFRSCRLPVH